MAMEILSDMEYAAATERVSELMDCRPYTPEAEELVQLVDAIEAYEVRRWPIDEPTAADAAAFRAEQVGG